MKKIVVPKPIPLKDLAGNPTGRVMSFSEFVLDRLCDEAFQKAMPGMRGVLAAVEVQQELKGGGEEIRVPDEAHAALVKAIKHPSQPYNMAVAMQLLPFMQAIVD